MKNDFKSQHDLLFEIGRWDSPFNDEKFIRFRVGTCHGLWKADPDNYIILAVNNETPGNGHFEDVLEWFYKSCIRDKKGLRFLDCMNTRFKYHLITKRGFSDTGHDNVEISYDKIKENSNGRK